MSATNRPAHVSIAMLYLTAYAKGIILQEGDPRGLTQIVLDYIQDLENGAEVERLRAELSQARDNYNAEIKET